MGDPADRDQVDAGGGDLGDGLGGDARPTPRSRPGRGPSPPPASGPRLRSCREARRRPPRRGPPGAGPRSSTSTSTRTRCPAAARARATAGPTCARDQPVVVLDEHRVVQPEAVVRGAAHPHRVLLERAQTGGRSCGCRRRGRGRRAPPPRPRRGWRWRRPTGGTRAGSGRCARPTGGRGRGPRPSRAPRPAGTSAPSVRAPTRRRRTRAELASNANRCAAAARRRRRGRPPAISRWLSTRVGARSDARRRPPARRTRARRPGVVLRVQTTRAGPRAPPTRRASRSGRWRARHVGDGSGRCARPTGGRRGPRPSRAPRPPANVRAVVVRRVAHRAERLEREQFAHAATQTRPCLPATAIARRRGDARARRRRW